MLIGAQRHLVVKDLALSRMAEAAFAAASFEDIVPLPEAFEIGTGVQEFINQTLQRGFFEIMLAIGAKFCRDAAGPNFPIDQKRTCSWRLKDEAQQIGSGISSHTRNIEPAGKKFGGGIVPAEDIPVAPHEVGRYTDFAEQVKQRRRDFVTLEPTVLGITPVGNLEKIGTFATTEVQGVRQAGQRFSRDIGFSTLFDPRIPRRADADELGKLFPPQTERSSTAPEREPEISRLTAFANDAKKSAEFLAARIYRFVLHFPPDYYCL